MSEKKRLEDSIKSWCAENHAKLEHDPDTPLGECYEVQWIYPKTDPPEADPQSVIIRFIDIYPRGANKIIVRKGIRFANHARAGSIYNRTIDQIYTTLSELKPFVERLASDYVLDPY